jgi:hypothetical protein
MMLSLLLQQMSIDRIFIIYNGFDKGVLCTKEEFLFLADLFMQIPIIDLN